MKLSFWVQCEEKKSGKILGREKEEGEKSERKNKIKERHYSLGNMCDCVIFFF